MRIFLLILSFIIFPTQSFAENKIAFDPIKTFKEINNNWFNDDFMKRKMLKTYSNICSGKYIGESQILDCIKLMFKNDKYDAEYQRALVCSFHIRDNFPPEYFANNKKEIKKDCIRLYREYKNNDKLWGRYGFPNWYIAWIKNKNLPFYEGEYKNGIPHGRGTFYSEDTGSEDKVKNALKYTGQFKDGKFHGQGVSIWGNGNRYQGDYKNGVIHGRGTYEYTIGDVYEGEFQNGKREGKGSFFKLQKGEKYIGYWSNGEKNGEGIVFDLNGKKIQEGIWINSKFYKSQKVILKNFKKGIYWTKECKNFSYIPQCLFYEISSEIK